MKIIIEVNNGLTEKDILNLFFKEFKKQLNKGVTSGAYKSEFLNFEWSSE